MTNIATQNGVVKVNNENRIQKIKENLFPSRNSYELMTKLLNSDLEWLFEQAEKVEELEKRFKEQIQNSHCIICGDDATEVRQGSYYCYECCK